MFIILQLFPYKILSHVTWVVCFEQITVMVSSVVGNSTLVSCKIWSTCQWLGQETIFGRLKVCRLLRVLRFNDLITQLSCLMFILYVSKFFLFTYIFIFLEN